MLQPRWPQRCPQHSPSDVPSVAMACPQCWPPTCPHHGHDYVFNVPPQCHTQHGPADGPYVSPPCPPWLGDIQLGTLGDSPEPFDREGLGTSLLLVSSQWGEGVSFPWCPHVPAMSPTPSDRSGARRIPEVYWGDGGRCHQPAPGVLRPKRGCPRCPQVVQGTSWCLQEEGHPGVLRQDRGHPGVPRTEKGYPGVPRMKRTLLVSPSGVPRRRDLLVSPDGTGDIGVSPGWRRNVGVSPG